MTTDDMLAIKDRTIAELRDDRRLRAACAAMQGMMADGEYWMSYTDRHKDSDDEWDSTFMAKLATQQGDCLLAELDRTENTKGDET